MNDPDQELIDATRGLLQVLARWGLDFEPAYAAGLAAVAAKEQATIDEVKAMVVNGSL